MIARRSLIGGAAALGGLALAGLPRMGLAQAAEEIALWPGTPPGRGKVTGPEKIGGEGAGYGALSNISVPRMRVYRPEHANGRAVIVCGGGGYFRIQLWKESTPAARWLQHQGYTVFELLFRLPADGWEASAPFMDAQRAMKIVRTRATEFGVAPDRIGILGFSAGGHLAGFTAYQPDRALYAGSDSYEAAKARPDFAALLFPVVTLRAPYDTTRTRREIVGEKASPRAEASWSLDSYASKDSPPTILFASADDRITPPGHSLTLFEALNSKGASVEMHMFRDGGHGWGLGSAGQTLSQWPQLFLAWETGLSAS